MAEALSALDIAFDYAEKQMSWYQWYGELKFYFHRVAGVFAILSSLFVAYLSASSFGKEDLFLGYPKNKLVSFFALAGAVSISLSSFFGWESSWRSHRIAQFQIESVLNNAKIEKLHLLRDKKDEELFELAASLSKDVGRIVLFESKQYFDGLKSPSVSIDDGKSISYPATKQ